MPPLGGTKLKAGVSAAPPLALSPDPLLLVKHAKPSEGGPAMRRSNCSAIASHWSHYFSRGSPCNRLIVRLTIQFLRFV